MTFMNAVGSNGHQVEWEKKLKNTWKVSVRYNTVRCVGSMISAVQSVLYRLEQRGFT